MMTGPLASLEIWVVTKESLIPPPFRSAKIARKKVCIVYLAHYKHVTRVSKSHLGLMHAEKVSDLPRVIKCL